MVTKFASLSNLEIQKDTGVAVLYLNPKVYALDVVFSAAYFFTDRCYVLIDGDPLEEIVVELRLKDKLNDPEKIAGEFSNELLNYANFQIQRVINAKLREAIIESALKKE